MNYRMRCSLYGFKCSFDDVLSRLGQYLHSHVVRYHIALDQGTHKTVFGLGCCRETNLDLLKSDIHKHLEKFDLLFQSHRLDQCLISIS